MPLIHWKIHLELNSIEDCIWSNAGNCAKFEITNAKLHVPIVTLSATDNPNLKKQLSNGFKRSFHWNDYQTIPAKVKNNRNNKVLKGYLLLLMMLQIMMKQS